MTHYDSAADRSTDPRPDYVILGTDGAGAHHVYRTRDETVHVVRDDTREHVEQLGDRPVEEWMAFVGDRRDWAETLFGLGIAGLVERALA